MLGTARELEKDQYALAIWKLPDAELADHVIESLPSDTYHATGVDVRTIQHIFPQNEGQPLETRKIVLYLTTGAKIQAFFSSLFTGLGFFPGKTKYYEKTISEVKLKEELVQSIFQREEEWEEIRTAYLQAAKIQLFVAQNFQYISLKIDQSTFPIYTYGAGKTCNFLGNFALFLSQLAAANKSGNQPAST